jgi:hypothetical protein
MALEDVVSKKVVEYEFRAVKGTEGAGGGNKDMVDAMDKGFKKLGDRMLNAQRRTRKLSQATAQARSQFAKFLGVSLSLLFISKALSAVFKGLIDPVMQITGVMDVWRATLISVLAPVIIPLAMFLIKLMTVLMGLPKEVKILIGVFVVLGYIFFSLLGWVMQFVLLLGALGMGAAGSAAGAIAAGWAIVLPILTAVGAAVGIVVAVFLALWRIWEGIMKSDWWKFLSGLLIIIGIIIAVILGAPAIVVAVVGVIIAAIVYLADKWKWLGGVIMAILGIILTPLLFLYDLIKGIVDIFSGKGWQGFTSTSGYWKQVGDKFNPTKMASGGVVTRPTLAMVGEAGPEAVIPLDETMGQPISVNINISGDFTGSGGPDRLASTIQSMLRDELRRLGVR